MYAQNSRIVRRSGGIYSCTVLRAAAASAVSAPPATQLLAELGQAGATAETSLGRPKREDVRGSRVIQLCTKRCWFCGRAPVSAEQAPPRGRFAPAAQSQQRGGSGQQRPA